VSSTAGRVPAIPVTSYIKDEHVRNSIDALKAGWELRNGITGTGEKPHQFITKADVLKLIADQTTTPATVTVTQTTTTTPTTTSDFTTFLQIVDAPVNKVTFENMGWAVDIVQKSINGSLVGIHSHVTSDATHTGNVWGFATEAWNAPTKTAGLQTQLFGGEVSVLQTLTTSVAERHAGLLTVFKNRYDYQDFPVNGAGVYNRGARAIYIDSDERTGGLHADGSFGPPSQDPMNLKNTTRCGWETGIYFAPQSMDSASTASPTAVGIDMSNLANSTPYGGHYYDRLKASIALPPNVPITWDKQKSVGTTFNDQTGNFEFSVNGRVSAAINFSMGCLYQSKAGGNILTYYIDMPGGWDPTGLFSMRSENRTTGQPNNAGIYAWLRFYSDNVPLYFAVYR
jgi:hypothetical protein